MKISFTIWEIGLVIIAIHRIGFSRGIDVPKSNNSKECIICPYSFFNHGFENSVCNGCHDFTILCLSCSNIAVITVTGVDCNCIILDISKSDAIHLLENIVLNYRGDIKFISKKSILKIESATITLTIWSKQKQD